MSEDIKLEDINETSTSEAEETTPVVDEQDPLKEELEKVQKKEGRTEAEKAAYSLKKNAERARELGVDPAHVLGFSSDKPIETNSDDDEPVTVGMLRKIQQDSATKTALQLADDIDGETERELTKYHIENSIKSTGNPKEDLRLARAIVNAAKNQRIIEEMGRKGTAKTFSSASSAEANYEAPVELTQDELSFMKAPFNLSKQQIIDARPKKT